MFSLERPTGFTPTFEAAGCFLEHDGKILMLKRAPEKIEGNKWGIPGGKVATGESLQEAIIREILEETGLLIHKEELKYLLPAYVSYDSHSNVYYMFSVRLKNEPSEIKLNPQEHADFAWFTPIDIIRGTDMMQHTGDCVRIVYDLA